MRNRGFGIRALGIGLLQAAVIVLAFAPAVNSWAAADRPVIQRVAPAYPEIAKRLKIGGVVHLEATVDPSGKVTDVKSLTGNRVLQPAAEDAVRRWKFAAGPAVSTVGVDISFTLNN